MWACIFSSYALVPTFQYLLFSNDIQIQILWSLLFIGKFYSYYRALKCILAKTIKKTLVFISYLFHYNLEPVDYLDMEMYI